MIGRHAPNPMHRKIFGHGHVDVGVIQRIGEDAAVDFDNQPCKKKGDSEKNQYGRQERPTSGIAHMEAIGKATEKASSVQLIT